MNLIKLKKLTKENKSNFNPLKNTTYNPFLVVLNIGYNYSSNVVKKIKWKPKQIFGLALILLAFGFQLINSLNAQFDPTKDKTFNKDANIFFPNKKDSEIQSWAELLKRTKNVVNQKKSENDKIREKQDKENRDRVKEITDTEKGGDVIYENYLTKYEKALNDFDEGFTSFVNWGEKAINFIAVQQLSTINSIQGMTFGSKTMFGFLMNLLRFCAIIGVIYQLVEHVRRTEKLDNIHAITGYFKALGLMILFGFSEPLTNQLVGLNQNVNSAQIATLGSDISSSIKKEILNKRQTYINEITPVLQGIARENAKDFSFGSVKRSFAYNFDKAKIDMKYSSSMYAEIVFACIMGIIIVCSLAIPIIMIVITIKVLLSVCVAGSSIVFLLSFIPGFESYWKTFLLNILNILLWIPIFNALIAFTLQMVFLSMGSDMSTWSFIWLMLIATSLAGAIVGLTTSAASMIVSGAGTAGSMAGMSSMNAISVAGKGAGLAAGATALSVGGGAIAAKGAKAFGKGAIKSIKNLRNKLKNN